MQRVSPEVLERHGGPSVQFVLLRDGTVSVTPSSLIDALRRPDAFPHECSNIQLLETHISWVLLTGNFAYKLKKPLDFGFADFRVLKQRLFYCTEELRLNRRFSPDLYLRVAKVTEGRDGPEFDGTGQVIDYAVCMRQFDPQSLLCHRTQDLVHTPYVSRLADHVGQFHNDAAVAEPETDFGSPQQIIGPVRDNFQCLSDADESMQRRSALLLESAETEFARLRPFLETRRTGGMIRECHGDLHLGNMFLQDGEIHVFDGIEFSENLRWIDIINDIAFTVMDLEEKALPQIARRFLNRWLEVTGDYAGIRVLPFYCAYRAAVRAKIDAIRLHQPDVSNREQRRLTDECCDFLNLCGRFTRRHRPALIITSGLSGSGKTTITQDLIEGWDVIRLRSDIERKRMFGLSALEQSTPSLRSQMYSPETNHSVYQNLEQLAESILRSGFPVVVDAAFLKWEERQRFMRLASRLSVPFLIIHCQADARTLRQRVHQRSARNDDASEADAAVLQHQLDNHDRLTLSEQAQSVDGRHENLTAMVAERIGLMHW